MARAYMGGYTSTPTSKSTAAKKKKQAKLLYEESYGSPAKPLPPPPAPSVAPKPTAVASVSPPPAPVRSAAPAQATAPKLPEVPMYTPGKFSDYLAENAYTVLTPEQIQAEAERLRKMQIDPQVAQIEANRQAMAERYRLAREQAGAGKDEALRGIDEQRRRAIQGAMARAIRSNLVSSNIPEEVAFTPIEREAIAQRASVEESIGNTIAQIELEAALGDKEAQAKLEELAKLGGLIQAQAIAELQRQERGFGEQARSNRFREFAGIEDLTRQAKQGNFSNQMALAQLQESIRQANLADERARAAQALQQWQARQSLNLRAQELANASAKSPFDEGDMVNTINNVEAQFVPLEEAVKSNALTAAEAKARTAPIRKQYDMVFGSGAFDDAYGARMSAWDPQPKKKKTSSVWDNWAIANPWGVDPLIR